MINFVHDIFIFSNLRGEDVCGQRVEEALAYLIFSSFLFHMKTKLHWNYIFCGDGKDTSECSFCRNSEFFIGEIMNTAYIFTGFLLVLLNFHFIYLFFFSIQVWQVVTSPFLISYSSVVFGELGCNTTLMPSKVRKRVLICC